MAEEKSYYVVDPGGRYRCLKCGVPLVKGDAVFTTPVLDPFVDRGGVSPSMVTDDSSILYFYD